MATCLILTLKDMHPGDMFSMTQHYNALVKANAASQTNKVLGLYHRSQQEVTDHLKFLRSSELVEAKALALNKPFKDPSVFCDSVCATCHRSDHDAASCTRLTAGDVRLRAQSAAAQLLLSSQGAAQGSQVPASSLDRGVAQASLTPSSSLDPSTAQDSLAPSPSLDRVPVQASQAHPLSLQATAFASTSAASGCLFATSSLSAAPMDSTSAPTVSALSTAAVDSTPRNKTPKRSNSRSDGVRAGDSKEKSPEFSSSEVI